MTLLGFKLIDTNSCGLDMVMVMKIRPSCFLMLLPISCYCSARGPAW